MTEREDEQGKVQGSAEENRKAPVVLLRARNSETEIERLNRLTGLSFDTLPTSLIDNKEGLQLAQEDGEELIYRALYLWAEKEKKPK